MLLNRNSNTTQHIKMGDDNGDMEKVRCMPLFISNEEQEGSNIANKMEELTTMPSYIPIRINCIQCEFGKMKKLTIPL